MTRRHFWLLNKEYLINLYKFCVDFRWLEVNDLCRAVRWCKECDSTATGLKLNILSSAKR